MRVKLVDVISPAPLVRCGDSEYPVLSMTMHDGIVLQSERFKKQLASVDQSAYKVVNRGQLVVGFPIDEGVLYVQKVADAGIMSPAYNIWDIDNAAIDADYLELCLHSPKAMQYYLDNLRGTTARRRSIPNSVLLDLPIYLPNKDVQRNTVKTIAKVSGLIAMRKKQLQKLDDLVKSRFIELFGTVKNNHQEYPVIKISGCAKLQGGFAFKSSDYLDNGIRLVQISNVNKDTLDWDSINCVPQTFLQKYKDFELHVGDLVLAMTRPVIKSLDAVKIATVSENDVPSLLNQRVGRFIIDITKINSTYLMLCCQMTEFREYVEAMSGNSLQPNISSKQVEDYSIVLPPLELQEQFAAFVEQTDKSKSTIQQSLNKLELLKKSPDAEILRMR